MKLSEDHEFVAGLSDEKLDEYLNQNILKKIKRFYRDLVKPKRVFDPTCLKARIRLQESGFHLM